MNKFTAQELSDFYQKLADGGEIDYRLLRKDCFGHSENGPHMGCSKDVWRIKPTKKVIDLSVLIKSGIDCEFTDNQSNERKYIGKLVSLIKSDNLPFVLGDNQLKMASFRYCQPRMNHKHAWQGGECPLPEGFMVKVWFRDGSESTRSIASGNGLYWGHNNHGSDIIAFEVIGIADGYVMPWEKDND